MVEFFLQNGSLQESASAMSGAEANTFPNGADYCLKELRVPPGLESGLMRLFLHTGLCLSRKFSFRFSLYFLIRLSKVKSKLGLSLVLSFIFEKFVGVNLMFEI